MARIRSIHPGLYTDEAFVSLSMAARVLLPGIWTECDDNGVFEWKPIKLKMRIFPADNIDVEPLLLELEATNCVCKFTHEGKSYGLVRNFRAYQRPQKPVGRYPLPEEFREFVGLKPHQYSTGTVPVRDRYSTGTGISPQMEDGGDKRKEEGGRKKETKYGCIAGAMTPTQSLKNQFFEEFWKAYPKRKGPNPKKPAEQAFGTAMAKGADPAAIIAAARNRTGIDREKIGTAYVPQAVTWLQQERWVPETKASPDGRPVYLTPPPGCQTLDEIYAKYGVKK